MSKKPEGPIGWTQSPAQGGQKDEYHAENVERENAAHGDTPRRSSGPKNNQGGK